ncbi:MAG: CRISPR-associated endonuclease Cas2 [Parcubacteria group bacterium]|nr:CRISPR-associated endonuclease Cas2 [Parcubacteria group bacterium]
MSKKRIPKTRAYLQKLTRRIERLESDIPISFGARGTGVRAGSFEIGARIENRIQANKLRVERDLVRNGLLEIQQRGAETTFSLTVAGLLQVLKDRIVLERREMLEDERCFVIFDVPEDIRKTRNTLRHFLKQAGFKQVQQSVWVTDKDVADDMRQLVEELKISDWVRVIVGRLIETEYTTAVV